MTQLKSVKVQKRRGKLTANLESHGEMLNSWKEN